MINLLMETKRPVNPKLCLYSDIKASLKTTIIQPDLINTVLKYFKPSIKVEDIYGKISHYTQDDFNVKLDTSYMKNVDICGTLELINPIEKFKGGIIQKIKGNVIVAGNATGMFCYAMKFDQDISRWDVSKVTNMYVMFYGATKFNSDLSGWDVSKVTNMNGMFGMAGNFDQNISGWDVSKVTNVCNMFYGATKFNSDLSAWDLSKVIHNKRLMF